MKLKTLLVALAAVSAISFAQAQDQGGQQGGPPPPRMGGMRQGPPMGGIGLLLNPRVSAELRLTPEQIDQLEALHPAPGQGMERRGGGDQGEGGPPPGGGHEEEMKKLKAILNADQFKRFTEIELQAMGPRAFTRPDVVKQLGLSDDQVEKIKGVLEANRPQRGQGGPPPQDGAADPRAKVLAQVTALLTNDQKSKWTSMIGKPFKLPLMRRGPGGRGGPGGGGPGGPGGGPDGGGPGGPPPGEPGGGGPGDGGL